MGVAKIIHFHKYNNISIFFAILFLSTTATVVTFERLVFGSIVAVYLQIIIKKKGKWSRHAIQKISQTMRITKLCCLINLR